MQLIVIVAIIVAVYVQNHREKKAALDAQMKAMQSGLQKEEGDMSEQKNDKDQIVIREQPKTRDLFLETLTKMGCQYEFGEEDGRILFAYQGENFVVDASNDRHFITIWDTFWGHVELYDIDEMTRLRRAINESNINNGVTTFYSIDEAGNNVDVHCKSIILFISQIPDLEGYLRVELNEFFRVHHFVGSEMVKLREQEKC